MTETEIEPVKVKATVRMDPTTRFVRSLPGRFFLLREAAMQLGVSDRTLRRLIKKEGSKLGPSKMTHFGKGPVYLYTRADIEKIRQYFEDIKQVITFEPTKRPNGRPRKWTAVQRRERMRLYSSINYHKKKAEQLKATGADPEGLAMHKEKIAQGQAELKNMVQE